jgi:hypothetical protein
MLQVLQEGVYLLGRQRRGEARHLITERGEVALPDGLGEYFVTETDVGKQAAKCLTGSLQLRLSLYI